jgi:colicin import membrane protein
MKMHESFQHEVLINDLIADGKIKDVSELSNGANDAINDFNEEADKVVSPFLDANNELNPDTEFEDAVIAKLERLSEVATNEILASVGDDYVSAAEAAQQKADADAAAKQKADAEAALLAQQQAAAQQQQAAEAAAKQKADADAAAALAAEQQRVAADAAAKRRADAAAAFAAAQQQKAQQAQQAAQQQSAPPVPTPEPEKKEKSFFGWFGG